MMRYIYAGIAVMVAVSAMALAPITEETLEIYNRAARITAVQMPRIHLTHRYCGDFVATNALNVFLSSLDFDHSIFLAEDIERFREEELQLDNQLRRGDLDFPVTVYEVLMTRMSNRVAYVEELLNKGFDFTVEEDYEWKRKDAPWPEDEKAWDELWRKKIKNQYLSRKIARELAEEKRAAKQAEGAADTPAADVTEEAETVTSDTDEAAVEEEELDEDLKQTPEESILKSYRQLLSVLQDNDAHWLMPLFITSFARSYDPHSDYMSAHNTEDFDINMKLSLVGIGALLSTEDGAAKVVRLIPGGPAEHDGRLKAGDKIIAVAQDDEPAVSILHWPLSKSVRLIRGEKDTRVVLSIIPASDSSGATVEKIDLIRDEVKLEEQAAKGEVRRIKDENGQEHVLGVITVPDFYADVEARNSGNPDARSVTRDVARILDEFSTNDVAGVVLDLRNNGGGLLSEAVDLAGLFIKEGPVVQVKSGLGVQVLSDSDKRVQYDGPLMVLINRQSASASEIVAGALKDYGRAVLVGDSHTHGKGTVQSLIPLNRRSSELGSLKLTTASFYRIEGSSTQQRGVAPHIVVPSMLDYMEIGEETLPRALPWSSVKPLRYQTDADLPGIIELLNERSEQRRDSDERFQAYAELLEHFRKQRESKVIPLDYESRLAKARREKEMSEMLKEEALLLADSALPEDNEDGEEEETEDDDWKSDIILGESLQIMADYLTLPDATVAEKDALPEAAGAN